MPQGIAVVSRLANPSINAHQGVRATDRTFAAGVGLSTWEQPALGTCMVCIVLSCSAQIHAGSYRLLSGEINPAIPDETLTALSVIPILNLLMQPQLMHQFVFTSAMQRCTGRKSALQHG